MASLLFITNSAWDIGLPQKLSASSICLRAICLLNDKAKTVNSDDCLTWPPASPTVCLKVQIDEWTDACSGADELISHGNTQIYEALKESDFDLGMLATGGKESGASGVLSQAGEKAGEALENAKAGGAEVMIILLSLSITFTWMLFSLTVDTA